MSFFPSAPTWTGRYTGSDGIQYGLCAATMILIDNVSYPFNGRLWGCKWTHDMDSVREKEPFRPNGHLHLCCPFWQPACIFLWSIPAGPKRPFAGTASNDANRLHHLCIAMLLQMRCSA